MPKFKIDGEAGQIALSVTKGGQTKIWPPASNNIKSITIDANRLEGTGPAAQVYLVAYAEGFQVPDHWNELSYIWDFGEQGQYYDTFVKYNRRPEVDDFVWDKVYQLGGEKYYVTDGTKMAGPAVYLGPNKNIAHGPSVGYAFWVSDEEFDAQKLSTGETFVTRTVTCRVESREMMVAGEAPVIQTVQFKINDHRARVGKVNTIYISPTGSFPTDAGIPSANKVATWREAMNAGRLKPECLYLFNRGEIHNTDFVRDPTDGLLGFNKTTNYDFMAAGAYGTGADPILLTERTIFKTSDSNQGFELRAEKNPTSEIIYWGLNKVGPFDAAAPWLTPWGKEDLTLDVGFESAYGLEGIKVQYFKNATVYGCRVSGHNKTFFITSARKNAVFANCSSENWQDYGFFANDGCTKFAVVGFQSIQKEGTVGSVYRGDNYANHGPFRISVYGKGDYLGLFYMGVSQFRSLNSWGGLVQPVIRVGGNGFSKEYFAWEDAGRPAGFIGDPNVPYDTVGDDDSPFQQRGNYDRVMGEVSSMMGTGAFKGAIYPKKVIYDRIYNDAINNTSEGNHYAFGAPGVVCRNCMTIIGDNISAQGPINGIYGYRSPSIDEPSHYSVTESEINIYGVTIVDKRTTTTMQAEPKSDLAPFSGASEDFGITFANALTHTPNRDTNSADKTNLPLSVRAEVTRMTMVFYKADYPHAPNPLLTAPPPPLTAVIPTDAVDQLLVPLPGSPAYRSADLNARIPLYDFFGKPNFGPGIPNPHKGAIGQD